MVFIHTTLIPFLNVAKEIKTKPTQHSVKELRGLGIQPDIILCRTTKRLNNTITKKISLFCDIAQNAVVQVLDVKSIYEVPLNLFKEKLDSYILAILKLKTKKINLKKWSIMVQKIKKLKKLKK